ncbi:MAG: phosphoribosylanthranilate isomerase [Acidobacteriota bacterium]
MSAGRGFPFPVKVCGVRSTAEAELCARAGATHVGINPWPHSPRRVTPAQARSLAEVSRRLGLVPVLLHLPGSPLGERDLLSFAPAVVQWYGPLPEALLRRFLREGLAVWEARKAGGDRVPGTGNPGTPEPPAVFAPGGGLGPPTGTAEREPPFPYPAMAPPRRGTVLLLDGPGPGAGGTGRPWAWGALRGAAFPFLLAGGLDPENVARAVEACSPSGVDAASGVESSPGRKEPGRLRAFCAAARESLLRWGGPPPPTPRGGAP